MAAGSQHVIRRFSQETQQQGGPENELVGWILGLWERVLGSQLGEGMDSRRCCMFMVVVGKHVTFLLIVV